MCEGMEIGVLRNGAMLLCSSGWEQEKGIICFDAEGFLKAGQGCLATRYYPLVLISESRTMQVNVRQDDMI